MIAVVGGEHKRSRSGFVGRIAVSGPVDRSSLSSTVHLHRVGQKIVLRIHEDVSQIQRPFLTHCDRSGRRILHACLDGRRGVRIAASRVKRHTQAVVDSRFITRTNRNFIQVIITCIRSLSGSNHFQRIGLLDLATLRYSSGKITRSYPNHIR